MMKIIQIAAATEGEIDGMEAGIFGLGDDGKLYLYKNEVKPKLRILRNPAGDYGSIKDQMNYYGWPDEKTLQEQKRAIDNGLSKGLLIEFTPGTLPGWQLMRDDQCKPSFHPLDPARLKFQ